MENENYVPFGPEWRKDVMKLKKDDLVTLWAESLKKLEDVEPLQNLMNEVEQWSDLTFGDNQRAIPILHHLLKEVPELIEALTQLHRLVEGVYTQRYLVPAQIEAVKLEYADCFMLILDAASHSGFSAPELLAVTNRKLAINKLRKWGTPDCNGVVEHIREEDEHGN